MYFVYILRCADSSLYCGITTDVKRRFREHQDGKGGNYTRSHKVLQVVYTEKCKDRSTALKREIAIKKLSRGDKLLLIQNDKVKRSA
jgi:predicted GIY-YIG superfamily endonuclease